jgi:PTS system fructose-specific IIC component/PTS system nitrogen regulatory IIA component
MFLHEIFQPEHIKLDLEAADKDEVFEELVDHFCQVEKNNARDEILEALLEREAKMSTGIHKGLAVPHGRTTAVDSLKGVLGVSRKGIDYEALDGDPVYLVFMLIAPMQDPEKHLRILKRLAELLEDPQFYAEMLAQNTPAGVYKIICKYEDLLSALDY